MTPGRIAGALAVFAVLAVLALFFFPGMDGPYPAVHGPVTALLSLRAAVRLRAVIRAGVKAARTWLAQARMVLVSFAFSSDVLASGPVAGLSAGSLAVLRC